MDFIENIFRRLTRTKKLQKAKIKVWQLLSKSDNVWSPLPDPGEQNWQNLAKIVGFWPNSFESGRIRPKRS